MIHASKIGLRTKLVQSLVAGSDIIRIAPQDVPRWRPEENGVRGTFWAILDDGVKREVVMITDIVSGGVSVLRAQDGTNAANFAAGTCLVVEWTESAMRELLGTMGLPEPVVQPGVYCLTCTTCITVNDQGQITAINGVEKC